VPLQQVRWRMRRQAHNTVVWIRVSSYSSVRTSRWRTVVVQWNSFLFGVKQGLYTFIFDHCAPHITILKDTPIVRMLGLFFADLGYRCVYNWCKHADNVKQ
jgi:hypothetical protein